MFCPKCGTQNQEGAAFCKGCGNKLETTVNPAAVTPEPEIIMENFEAPTSAVQQAPAVAPMPQPQQMVNPAPQNNMATPKKNKLNLIVVVVGVVVVFIAASFVYSLLLNQNKITCVSESNESSATFTYNKNEFTGYSTDPKEDPKGSEALERWQDIAKTIGVDNAVRLIELSAEDNPDITCKTTGIYKDQDTTYEEIMEAYQKDLNLNLD